MEHQDPTPPRLPLDDEEPLFETIWGELLFIAAGLGLVVLLLLLAGELTRLIWLEAVGPICWISRRRMRRKVDTATQMLGFLLIYAIVIAATLIGLWAWRAA